MLFLLPTTNCSEAIVTLSNALVFSRIGKLFKKRDAKTINDRNGDETGYVAGCGDQGPDRRFQIISHSQTEE